jgi:hypothetical protein
MIKKNKQQNQRNESTTILEDEHKLAKNYNRGSVLNMTMIN